MHPWYLAVLSCPTLASASCPCSMLPRSSAMTNTPVALAEEEEPFTSTSAVRMYELEDGHVDRARFVRPAGEEKPTLKE